MKDLTDIQEALVQHTRDYHLGRYEACRDRLAELGQTCPPEFAMMIATERIRMEGLIPYRPSWANWWGKGKALLPPAGGK